VSTTNYKVTLNGKPWGTAEDLGSAQTVISRQEPADYFGTFTGGRAYVHHADRSDIRLVDIAVAGSRICRYGGHAEYFYSAAQHSVLVSHLVPRQFALCALFHDAAESFLGDVISPLKRALGESYARLERAWEWELAKKFGYASQLRWVRGVRGMPPEVKAGDHLAFALECFDLLSPEHRERCGFAGPRPKGPTILPLSPEKAAEAWLRRYWQLSEGLTPDELDAFSLAA
jgi:hypothetical protein